MCDLIGCEEPGTKPYKQKSRRVITSGLIPSVEKTFRLCAKHYSDVERGKIFPIFKLKPQENARNLFPNKRRSGGPRR